MPIKVKDNLPAKGILRGESIFVMGEDRAFHQDIRPLKILVVNLMPNKQQTEVQILRLLSNTPLQLQVTFIRMESHISKHTSEAYLDEFYSVFDDIRDTRFDGMIITGAPVEQMPYEEVNYWSELCEIMEWSKTNVTSTFHICWVHRLVYTIIMVYQSISLIKKCLAYGHGTKRCYYRYYCYGLPVLYLSPKMQASMKEKYRVSARTGGEYHDGHRIFFLRHYGDPLLHQHPHGSELHPKTSSR